MLSSWNRLTDGRRATGTGKSVLLREIIEYCGGRHSGTVAITATTGIAALNIGGCTLHSWAGIGLGKETPKSFVGKCFAHLRTFGGKIINRWQQVNTLIIDEGELYVLHYVRVVGLISFIFSLDAGWTAF